MNCDGISVRIIEDFPPKYIDCTLIIRERFRDTTSSILNNVAFETRIARCINNPIINVLAFCIVYEIHM